MDLTVTSLSHPYGVRCHNCKREIKPGEIYRLRNQQTRELSTGPYTEDRVDIVVCKGC